MAQDILRLLDDLEPMVRKAFLAAINDIKSEAQMAVIIAAIQRKDLTAALAALNLDASFFQPLDDALRGAYLQGGVNALAGLPVLPDPFPGGAWLCGLMAATHAPNPSSKGKARD
ncbi:hypothetical protein JQX09_17615 [Sulfitobacter pseudonitzschiae]|uniref:Uncharacterized protein n=1 Tax=Pseudosulfitobacter pseudonitzschiae TaxID=1402135 RepID=A0A9Q2RW99_9RHOB|nr:hypothetical protein [Pseudosulfitobacter pseudonitzschiae]MBM2293750.1 hypothetical protein [Pseudosulfitobacter pseudonitzschiae]MBM2298668.1 hypothetical protein [Pseudosulfitobacter pseudonitzschiae]MBM2303582.1 hypothetical protein [Pseudosulfitobacter pseudonitzschiae]MBM2313365.1 hypothetical protein [Pseudosulfitobacter pseudonitzschiae]MBM2318278.1 hypothetical protein [Pseudosulfitobacter pseudonitzschiae]